MKLLGRIDITKEELIENLIKNRNYIITFRSIYIVLNEKGKFKKVFTKRGGIPLIGRGRYIMTNKEHATAIAKTNI